MKAFLYLICVLIFSCSQKSSDKRQKNIYSDTATLYYNGKPLFIFGSSIDNLISKPSFYGDTINRQGGGFSYITIDTFFSAKQSTGILIGNLLIETNDNREIQKVYGHWAISTQMSDQAKKEAIATIRQKYFPYLPMDFVNKQTDSITHYSFIEEFKFFRSPDSGNITHRNVPHWRFDYEAYHK